MKHRNNHYNPWRQKILRVERQDLWMQSEKNETKRNVNARMLNKCTCLEDISIEERAAKQWASDSKPKKWRSEHRKVLNFISALAKTELSALLDGNICDSRSYFRSPYRLIRQFSLCIFPYRLSLSRWIYLWQSLFACKIYRISNAERGKMNIGK